MSQQFEFDAVEEEYQRNGDTPMLARIYRPRGAGPFPAVVDVHGGGWTSGTRMQNAAIAEALAKRGIVVTSLDFRNAPDGVYPAPIADINLGIRWFKTNATRFGSREDLVGGLGSSSGGHQLLVATLRARDPRYAFLPVPGSADVAFMVLCWPVADPLERFRFAQEGRIQFLLDAHRAYWPSEAAMAEGNPQLIVERGEATSLPPVLILQGTDDENLPSGMADRFAAAYRKAGGDAVVEKFPGEKHTFITKDPKSANSVRALDLMARFILDQRMS